jgi:D-alanyl-D-alanine carboxypeptidase
LTNAYVAGAQRHNAPLWEGNDGTKTNKSPVRARLSAIYVQVDTIAAGATGLTVRATSDAAGQLIIVPDTSATFSTGITTATAGGIVLKVDVDYKASDSDFYVHFKTNAGTCNVKVVEVAWEE